MNKNIFILIFLILTFLLLNYSFLDSLVISFLAPEETVFIERVIDGDTIVSNGSSIRLLGINSPEKGELYSFESTEFLENMVLNKNVEIRITGKDRYYRDLAYVFIDGENVNLELVKNGFANFYFPSGKDNYYPEFLAAWKECLSDNVNFCSESLDECGRCLDLLEFNVKEQKIILRNNCQVDCDLSGWTIKDEGRKKFVFGKGFVLGKDSSVEIIVGDGKDNDKKLFWDGETYVWTKSGDSLFLRDDKGGLVLWESY